MSDQTHKLNQTHNSRSEVAAIVATMSLTAALTVGAGSAYAAEEPDTETATSPEAQETAKAPAATTDAYTVTETVKTTDDTRQTFDTEADAQKYLDDAKAEYAEKDAADASATYEVTAEGPIQVETGATRTDTVEKTKDFGDEAAARQFVDDAKAKYEGEGYAVTGEVTQTQTGTTTSTTIVTEGEAKEFSSEADAQKYVSDGTAGYTDGKDGHKVTTRVEKTQERTTQKVTKTDAEGSKTFDTKDGAGKFVADGTAKYKDDAAYTVTSSVKQKDTGKTNSTTTLEETDSKGDLTSEDAAKAWVTGQTSKYESAGNITYKVDCTVTKVAGAASTTEETVAQTSKAFDSEEDANNFISSLKSQYPEASGYTVTVTTQKTTTSTTGQKTAKGKATTTTYGSYDTEDAANNAFAQAQKDDPSTDIHVVTFSSITPKTEAVKEATTETKTKNGNAYTVKAERDSAKSAAVSELQSDGYTVIATDVDTPASGAITYSGKYDYAAKSYKFSAGWAIVKQATWYAIWTPTEADAATISAIQLASSAKGADGSMKNATYRGAWSGFGTAFTGGKNSDKYTFTDNGDGTYTLSLPSGKISHMDYGTLPSPATYSYTIMATKQIPAETKTTYSFTKTVQDYEYSEVSKDQWTVTYKVDHTTLGTPDSYKATYTVNKTTTEPVYEYVANYKVTHEAEETVQQPVWKASYKVEKTTETPDYTYTGHYKAQKEVTEAKYLWQAAYGVTKTTTYQIPKPEEPTVPGTPDKPAHTTTVARNATAPQSQTDRGALPAHAEKASAIPQTSDGAQAVSVAGMFAAIGFGGVLASRRALKRAKHMKA